MSRTHAYYRSECVTVHRVGPCTLDFYILHNYTVLGYTRKPVHTFNLKNCVKKTLQMRLSQII